MRLVVLHALADNPAWVPGNLGLQMDASAIPESPHLCPCALKDFERIKIIHCVNFCVMLPALKNCCFSESPVNEEQETSWIAPARYITFNTDHKNILIQKALIIKFMTNILLAWLYNARKLVYLRT